MSSDEKTLIPYKTASGRIQHSAPVAGGFARPTPGGRPGARPVPPPPESGPMTAAAWAGTPALPSWTPPAAPLPASQHNPLLAASRELVSSLAQLGHDAEQRDVRQFRDWTVQQIQRFEQLCAQAEVHEEIRFYARYVLCTVLDELVIKTPWGSDGWWSRQSLLSQFHGETGGGERFFQLLDYLQQAPARNLMLLELMFVCLGLGFEGRYHLDPRGGGQLEIIREQLFHILRQQRGEPERDLSPHWQRINRRQQRLARYFPVWVVAALTGVILLGTYTGFSLLLGERRVSLLQRLDVAAHSTTQTNSSFPE